VIKSAAEIDLMRRSCDIGAASILATIRSTPELTGESQAFATVDYHSRMQGDPSGHGCQIF
jgi:Xaa-Pro aminopeptidase